MIFPRYIIVALTAGLGSAFPPSIPQPPSQSVAQTATTQATADQTVAAHPPATAPGGWTLTPVRAPGLQYHEFKSLAIGTEVGYHIWLPPPYETESDRRFPVLYWLHGSGGGQAGMPMVIRWFSKAIADGRIPAMILVFPNGLVNSMWCNSADGRQPVETMVIDELLPLVDQQYRTMPSREHRVIEGFSMGGYGAARLGFLHPELFGAVSILGGGPLQKDFENTPRANRAMRDRILNQVYGGEQEIFRERSPWRIAEKNAEKLRAHGHIRQVVGDQDETLPANRELHERLEALKIPHSYVELPGIAHDGMGVLRADAEGRAEFLRKALGADESIQTQPATRAK